MDLVIRNIVFILFFVSAIIAQNKAVSQSEKGISPSKIVNNQQLIVNSTYALVVGISDYQDKDIPDLRFADKDAEAFSNFLRSDAGGKLDKDHLKVLLNESATMAQFAIQLDWLLENTKENDLVYIYFSGHGDVEKKTLTQPGFLLCWDAPAQVYMSGGAFALPMLQEVISTLSIQNKAKVIVITDACRSGKLSGSSINGNQLTNANLAKQYTNEIKILSCQPNEYSIEGEQWGGGRGAFSFNLVNALYGMADANNDLSISLQEINRYLEDHVTAEVAPMSQLPMVLGNRNEKVASVNLNILAAIQSGKTSQMAMISAIDSRGMEDDVLASLDTSIRKTYQLFRKALKDKDLLLPEMACAEVYYSQLISEPKLSKLHTTLTRNYAAALQDEAQQTLNEWLKTSQDVPLDASANIRLPLKVFTEKVKLFPRCLDRAIELLGSKHYMYSTLKSRKYFFEAYLLANSNFNANKVLGEQALKLFRQSLEWQADQPHVYWQMSRVFGWNLLMPDSLEHYATRAMEVYPNWTTPCFNAAYMLSYKFNQQDRARHFLEMASKLDSNSVIVLSLWAIFHIGQKDFTEAERLFKKAIVLDSTNCDFWNNIGYLYNIMGRYAEAESFLKTAIRLDSTNARSWNNLGSLYWETHRNVEAELVFKKAIALDSTFAFAWNNLGGLYWENHRNVEAEPVFKKAIALDSTYVIAWSNLGSLYLNIGKFEEAELVIKKAISLDSTDASPWNNLGYLKLITRQYNESEQALKKAISIDPTFPNPRKHLGMVYFKTNRFEEARQNFLKAIALNPNYAGAMLGMAYLLTADGKSEEALTQLEKAIQKGSTYEQLEKDEDLARLRLAPEWKTFIQKYFPKQSKD
ncbi:MAG: tetratricopeptide repeat protein [Saprospiraceae bacterium]